MNILMFGPNGSGKGTQGALIKKAFGLAHIEPRLPPLLLTRTCCPSAPSRTKRPRNIWIAENSSLTPSPFPWSSKP